MNSYLPIAFLEKIELGKVAYLCAIDSGFLDFSESQFQELTGSILQPVVRELMQVFAP